MDVLIVSGGLMLFTAGMCTVSTFSIWGCQFAVKISTGFLVTLYLVFHWQLTSKYRSLNPVIYFNPKQLYLCIDFNG
jgi:hypothetical protein